MHFDDPCVVMFYRTVEQTQFYIGEFRLNTVFKNTRAIWIYAEKAVLQIVPKNEEL